jgi:hypothetical protein
MRSLPRFSHAESRDDSVAVSAAKRLFLQPAGGAVLLLILGMRHTCGGWRVKDLELNKLKSESGLKVLEI